MQGQIFKELERATRSGLIDHYQSSHVDEKNEPEGGHELGTAGCLVDWQKGVFARVEEPVVEAFNGNGHILLYRL